MAVHGILQPQNMQEKEDTMKYMSWPLQMVARQITSSEDDDSEVGDDSDGSDDF